MRQIHSAQPMRQVADLLQLIFVSELVSASKSLYVVAPWISNIPVIDNRTNAFLALAPGFDRAPVPLATVLCDLAARGTQVHVATKPPVEPQCRRFVDELKARAEPNLRLHEAENLHEKGILGDDYYLAGSMNLTHNGVTLNEEFVSFDTSPARVSETRIAFAQRWKGPTS